MLDIYLKHYSEGVLLLFLGGLFFESEEQVEIDW